MNLDHLILIVGFLLVDLICSICLMWMFMKWLVRNTRPKHGHCPPSCVCRKPGYVWPRRRYNDDQATNRRHDDPH